MTSPPRQLLSLMQQEFPDLKKLPSLWSPSYFVATTGKVSTEVVKRYIESQRNK
jgi:putative transposase